MTMLIASGLQIAGLLLTVIGSVILLRSLFITNDEMKKLSELPLHLSNDFGH